jgi:hypothetical protein
MIISSKARDPGATLGQVRHARGEGGQINPSP